MAPVLRRALAATVLLLALPAAAHAGERPLPGGFDLQAHRGGIGLTTEETLEGFQKAMRLGVRTLELDVQITRDGEAIVTHDRQVTATKCRDTRPAFKNDPQFPYVGDYVRDLTLEQVRTLRCDVALAQFPDQEVVKDNRLIRLRQILALHRCERPRDVWLNVEPKVEAGAPEQTAPREQFVQVVAKELRRWGVRDRATIQSFDWGVLMRMRQVDPALPLVALTNGQQFLQAGQPGASPWLGGLDVDDFGGSLVAAAQSFGADAISPVHGDPQNAGVETPGYVPYTTKAMVDESHAAGLKVIPWTVDDEPTMRALVDAGVDGLITDYPDRLRGVLAERGIALPDPVRSPRSSACLRLARAIG